MDPMDEQFLRSLLSDVAAGSVAVDEAITTLRHLPYENLGFARVDHHRAIRTGFPEVIFCQGKTAPQIVAIAQSLAATSGVVLGTRCDAEKFALVQPELPEAVYSERARTFQIGTPERDPLCGTCAVVTAGTADIPVAEEAAVVAEAAGCGVDRIFDVGVAGLHRLLEHRSRFDECDVIVVVAGMEGALASVVGGLVRQPVIAVPTSIGYGASFHGLAALLSMLNTCASGVAVVNIDNGFGAGYFGAMLCRQLADARRR
jgi:pyridinium-3,5-biscarboxylic acid mononucleotide synthase